MTTKRSLLWAAFTGIAASAVTLAVAELVALFVAAASSPLFAVGSFVIDLVPPWVKQTAIALFGTADKIVLLGSLGLLVLILAAIAGILEYRKPPFGLTLLLVVGLVALVAVLTRADSNPWWAFPTLLGVVAGAVFLRKAMTRLRDWAKAPASGSDVPRSRTEGYTRRGFLMVLVGAAGASAVVGVTARAINAGTTVINTVRDALTLPKPVAAVAPIPLGAELDVTGITPLVTSNDTFYRIDTALQPPTIDAATWTLKITGEVENEVEITFDELLALPLIETYVTLMCVSNEVGGTLTGNALWLGYPIRELLKRAKPTAGADMVLSKSIDGFTASSPLDVLLDEDRDSILAVGMNGEPLPIVHGFPVRMVVPGLYGYVSATKWVVELEVTRFSKMHAYWTDRGWSERGPVKTSSRIDVPRSGALVTGPRVAVAGIAWAQHVGIDAVEVRVDGGSWEPATLAEAISADTWRQWVYEWDAPGGDHTLEVRATDATGFTQSGEQVFVAPNGAEGWHIVDVSVG